MLCILHMYCVYFDMVPWPPTHMAPVGTPQVPCRVQPYLLRRNCVEDVHPAGSDDSHLGTIGAVARAFAIIAAIGVILLFSIAALLDSK